jgi:hypothetical protein
VRALWFVLSPNGAMFYQRDLLAMDQGIMFYFTINRSTVLLTMAYQPDLVGCFGRYGCVSRIHTPLRICDSSKFRNAN